WARDASAARCTISPDSKRLFVFADHGCEVFDPRTGGAAGRPGQGTALIDPDGDASPSVLAPDGSTVAGIYRVRAGLGAGHKVIRLWDSRTGAVIRDLGSDWEIMGGPIFSSDGRRVLALACREPVPESGMIRPDKWGFLVWATANGRLVQQLKADRYAA